jgi:hypothetical protein
MISLLFCDFRRRIFVSVDLLEVKPHGEKMPRSLDTRHKNIPGIILSSNHQKFLFCGVDSKVMKVPLINGFI